MQTPNSETVEFGAGVYGTDAGLTFVPQTFWIAVRPDVVNLCQRPKPDTDLPDDLPQQND